MKNKVIHHVFFWLKKKESETDLRKLISGLEGLRKIETVKELHIGIPAPTEQRPVVDSSYSASLLIFFDDVEGQNIYQDHKLHKKFVEDYSHLWESVKVYDSENI